MNTRSTKVIPNVTQITQSIPTSERQAPLEEVSWMTDDMYNYENMSEALQSIYAEMGVIDGNETMVYVTLIDGMGKGEDAGVFRGPAEDYDLRAIAMDHGTGRYRVKVYVKQPTGPKVLKANKVFPWKLSPREEAERKGRADPVPTAQPLTMADLDSVIERLARAMAPAPPPPAMDPVKMMEMMMTMMAKMQPARDKASDPMETIKLAFEISDRMSSKEPPAPREAGSNANDVFVAMIENFGPVLTGSIQQNIADKRLAQGLAPAETQAQQTAVHENPAELPAPAGEQPIGPIVIAGFTQDDLDQMRPGIEFLVAQAAAGNPVETYAELIIDNIPPEALQGMIGSPNPVAVMQASCENVSKYQEWFTELIDNVKKLLSDIENDDGGEKDE